MLVASSGYKKCVCFMAGIIILLFNIILIMKQNAQFYCNKIWYGSTRPTDNYEEDEVILIHHERLKLTDNPKAVLGAHNVYCCDEYKWTLGI